MLPFQRNKVDLSTLNEQERRAVSLYGVKPKKGLVHNTLKGQGKYFDSGDWAMAQSGKAAPNSVGTAIPSPENIPHASSPAPNQSLSPSSGGIGAGTVQNSTSPIRESPLVPHEGSELNPTPPTDASASATDAIVVQEVPAVASDASAPESSGAVPIPIDVASSTVIDDNISELPKTEDGVPIAKA